MKGSPRKSDPEMAGESVVIVDELAQSAAVDPTFGGMRESPEIELAYQQVVSALRSAHQSRYRHPAPEDDRDVFRELQSEVVMPHEELIGRLVLTHRERQRLTPEDEQQILKVKDDFCKKIKNIE